MGRRSSGPIGLVILGIGTTVAFFHTLGYIFESMEAIRILYSRSGFFWGTNFQIREEISGKPLDLKTLMSFFFLIKSILSGYSILKFGWFGSTPILINCGYGILSRASTISCAAFARLGPMFVK